MTKWGFALCLLGGLACNSGQAFVGCYAFDWTAFDDPRLIAPDLVPDGVRLTARASDEPGWRTAEPMTVVDASERRGAIAFWYDVLYRRRWKPEGDRVVITLADYGFVTWTITLTPMDTSGFQGEATYVSTMGGGRRESAGTLTARRCDDAVEAPKP